jgi:hypothetical protein
MNCPEARSDQPGPVFPTLQRESQGRRKNKGSAAHPGFGRSRFPSRRKVRDLTKYNPFLDQRRSVTLGMLSEPLPPRRWSKNALRYVGLK